MNKIEMNTEGGIYDEENIFCAMFVIIFIFMHRLWKNEQVVDNTVYVKHRQLIMVQVVMKIIMQV